jgi:hypothetical protein
VDKYKIAVFPFLIGLGLFLSSWFLSYPLSIDFVGDVVFNHISPFYWLSLPLMLSSLFLLGAFSKSHILRCATCVGIILVIFSLSFFYFSLPTSDSQYFRGLTEYFIHTKDLNSSEFSHIYFQWPSFFLIGYIVTSVSGLSLINAEFLLYASLGSLLTVALYVYASLHFRKGGFLAVIAFFISMFYFLDFQWVPFTLAFSLLLVLFMLESSENRQERPRSSVITLTLMLFFCISITHLFVALFFVLYLLARSIFFRKKRYISLFLLCSIIYFLVQLTLAEYSFDSSIQGIFRLPSEYSAIFQYTLSPVLKPIDLMAQNISRIVTISFVLICLVGFVLMFIKRKLRSIDLVIFLVGATYSALGFFLFLLGNRGLPIVFIPLSLGVAYLFETRLKRYLLGIILILLILFVCLPIHTSFNSYSGSFIPFQTKEESVVEHFVLDNYDWMVPSVVLAHAPAEVYLQSNLNLAQIKVTFRDEFSPNFPRITGDCILFTVGLENNFWIANYSIDQIILGEKLSVVYDNGFSKVTISGSNFS